MSSPTTPNIDGIKAETGQNTADGFQTLLLAIQNNNEDRVREIRTAKDRFEPKVFVLSTASTTSDLDIKGASVVHNTGASGFNLTGFLAPSTGKTRFVILHNSGAGTITLKQTATSAAANQLSLSSGADTTIAQNKSAGFLYLSSKWRQVF